MKYSRMVRRSSSSAPKPKRIKLILVKWEDATHIADDSGPELPGTMIAWTVGFQMQRDKKEVVLCMEFFEDQQKRNISTIPMGMVKTIRTLATLPVTFDAT